MYNINKFDVMLSKVVLCFKFLIITDLIFSFFLTHIIIMAASSIVRFISSKTAQLFAVKMTKYKIQIPSKTSASRSSPTD